MHPYAPPVARLFSLASILTIHLLTGPTVQSAAAQGVPQIALSKPLVEHPEPLTMPAAIKELSDGRLIVTDMQDRLVFLYDFAKGTATQVARQGKGPLEFQMPAGLFPIGDSVAVVDLVQGRLLILSPSGQPVRTERLVADGDAMQAIMKVGTIVGVDSRGRYYSETRGITLVPGKMPTMSDTVALVRWRKLGASGDTLAKRYDYTPMPKMGGDPKSGMRMAIQVIPYPARDSWAVFRDGRVVVVRSADYHSEWIDGEGQLARGPRVSYTPVPVTDGDRARYMKEMREQYERGLKMGLSMAGAGGQSMPKLTMDVEEPASWPKVKPPFVAVAAAPDGRAWVARPAPGGTDAVTYDVLAPGGKLERQVRVPPNVTLLGFGKGVLYAVRKDEDDLRYLQRYKLP